MEEAVVHAMVSRCWLSERMGPRYDDDNYLSCVYEDNRIMPIRCRRVSVGRSSAEAPLVISVSQSVWVDVYCLVGM